MVVEYKHVDSVIDDARGFTEKYIMEQKKNILETIVAMNEVICSECEKQKAKITLQIKNDIIDQIIIDAIEDLKRLKDFHPVSAPNLIKVAAYFGFWWLKRKPIVVKEEISYLGIDDKFKSKLLFVNEMAVAYFLIAHIFNKKKELCTCCDKESAEDQWKKARVNLLYYLAYRAESPKSIEAILASFTLHPIWETNQEFWVVSEKK